MSARKRRWHALPAIAALWIALHAVGCSTPSYDIPEHPTASPGRAAPAFPWPPPAASDMTVIPSAVLSGASQLETLADADAVLAAALVRAGYSGRRYFSVPNGFALVTRIEQFDAQGASRPEPGRWASDPARPETLLGILKGMFTGNPGRYRVFVFVVTDEPFAAAGDSVTRGDAMAWFREGLNVLPDYIAQRPFTPAYDVTALVYEFQQPSAGSTALLQSPGSITADDHLRRSGIHAHLDR